MRVAEARFAGSNRLRGSDVLCGIVTTKRLRRAYLLTLKCGTYIDTRVFYGTVRDIQRPLESIIYFVDGYNRRCVCTARLKTRRAITRV